MTHDVADLESPFHHSLPLQTSQVSEVHVNVPTSNILIPRTGNDVMLNPSVSVSSSQHLVTGHGFTVRDSTTTHYSVETLVSIIQQLEERLQSYKREARAHHAGYKDWAEKQAAESLSQMQSRYDALLAGFKEELDDRAQAALAARRAALHSQFHSEIHQFRLGAEQAVRAAAQSRDEAAARADQSFPRQYVER